VAKNATSRLLSRHQLAIKVGEIVGEVDLLDGPRVLDRVLVHLEELRVPHRPQREVEAGIENVGVGTSVGGVAEVVDLGGLRRECVVVIFCQCH
jgi:hypothetical protein